MTNTLALCPTEPDEIAMFLVWIVARFWRGRKSLEC